MKRYMESRLEAMAELSYSPAALPTVTIGEQEYFVDERLRQLRNVEIPWDQIPF